MTVDLKNSDPNAPGVHKVKKPLRNGRVTATGLLVKIFVFGLLAAIVLWLLPLLVQLEMWAGLASLLIGVAATVAIYGTKHLIPAKYLFPGVLLLIVLIVVPIAQTVGYSFTNFGDGSRGTKEEAVTSIVTNSVQQLPDSKSYVLSVGTKTSPVEGPFTFFLTSEGTDDVFMGTEKGLETAEPGKVTIAGGKVIAAEGYTILSGRQINEAGPAINAVTVPTEKGAIRAQGINRAFEGIATLEYDPGQDAIIDTANNETYRTGQVGDSIYFVDRDGQPAFDQSWLRNVGWSNYVNILTNPTIAGGFAGAFIWTMAFATLSVATTFALGLALAVVLNDPRIRGQKVMRSLLLLPYAVPGFIALLVWSSFYNRDFGLINEFLGGANIDWLTNPWLAKVAVLLTNLWMGFPYMFVVCTGALQSVPAELKEAASIDGASPFQVLRKITLPLLLISVAPLLVASFAFNFNNFNIIYLLTGGGPFTPGSFAGGTDILISLTYRIAFGGAGAQFGLAAAISVLLFVITGVMGALQFRATKALEDVN